MGQRETNLKLLPSIYFKKDDDVIEKTNSIYQHIYTNNLAGR